MAEIETDESFKQQMQRERERERKWEGGEKWSKGTKNR